MLLWTIMALLTGAAVLTVLWPLSRRGREAAEAADDDLVFYRDQLREIERECERGQLAPADAEAARAEAGRLLLRARAARPGSAPATGEPALRRRRAAAAIAISVLPLIGLAVYGALGSPRVPSRVAGAAQPGPAGDPDDALARMEAFLATHPDDGRGWDLLAPIYLRTGRFDDAAKAFGSALRLLGDSPERLAGYGEALVSGSGGVVSETAAAAFRKVVAIEPGSARARFYLALAAEQDGDDAGAREGYRTLVATAPADANWLPMVKGRLARLEDGVAATPVVASPEIQAMVSGLDARLADAGGSEAEWARLVRSFVVLGRRDEAVDRLGKARAALAAMPGASDRLAALARDLGLPGEGVRP